MTSNSMFWGDCLFNDFGDRKMVDVDQKLFPKIDTGPLFLPYFFAPIPRVMFLKVLWLTLALFWLSFASLLVHVGRFGYHC